MRAQISGLLACSSGAALAYLTVSSGYGIVYGQLSYPYVGGVAWPVFVIGSALLTYVTAMLALVIVIETIDKYEPPQLAGRTTYTLIGSTGLVGSAAGIIQTGSRIYAHSGTGLDIGSVVALLLVALPTLYASYCLWGPLTEPIRATRNANDETLNPEYVRKARVRRSGENHFPHHQLSLQRKESEEEQKKCRPKQNEASRNNEQITHTDLEFDWTIDTDISFDDVGGMSEVKRELERDVIKPLTTHREAAKKLGIGAQNVLFHGPPGTGKTYVARALATELELPFAQLSGADLQSKWINESAGKVKSLFAEAATVAEKKGGAVVFLDEFDSVVKERSGSANSHEEDNKVVNEFLNHLENTSEHNVVFICATNRIESLDNAAIRSGRIDKKLHVGKPDWSARISILQKQLDDLPHSLTEEQLNNIATQTEGLTAADLDRLTEESARMSLFERGDDEIKITDVSRALSEL